MLLIECTENNNNTLYVYAAFESRQKEKTREVQPFNRKSRYPVRQGASIIIQSYIMSYITLYLWYSTV